MTVSPTSITFIDGSLSDIAALIAAVPDGSRYFVLDPALDGVDQMAAIVADYAGLDAIHIVSHGAAGCLQLGSALLDTNSMDAYAAQLRAIGTALSSNGDLLLYGCNVAQGSAGQDFIGQLSAATGADVAASMDLTGATQLGGDWALESSSGSVETTALQGDGFASVLAAVPAIELSKVAAGTGGFVIYGQNAGDYSGNSVASAGDINGDGYDDVIIGAPQLDSNYGTGESYVIFGKASGFGASIDLAAVAAGTGGFVIRGQDGADRAGISVASAGDINGDGYDDLIIGASRGDADYTKDLAGESYVIFGKASGFASSINLEAVAAGHDGFVIYGQDAYDRSGTSVASAGDINGDGYDDLIIGAPEGDAAANAKSNAGDSYVVFGKSSSFGASIDLAAVAAGTGGFVIHGQDADDTSGISVASAGDINGDGYDDLIIGARDGDAAGNAKGYAGDSYVVFGKSSGFGASIDLAAVAAGTGGFVIHGRDAGDESGASVASAGDINGDGYDDLIVGARSGDAAANAKSDAGESYVIFGKSSGFGASIDLAAVAAGTGGFVIYGQDAQDLSGWSVASAGDINGDGFDDLIVGAPSADAAGNAKSLAGDSYVVFGKSSGFGTSIDLAAVAAGTGGFVIHGQDAYDGSGASVASAGDINGDGFDDLIVGAPYAYAAGNAKHYAGESYVIYGKDFTGSVTHMGSSAANTLIGTSGADIMVAGLGNDTVNGAAAADAINGGAGNDLITGGAGADRIDGGNGRDTASYASSATAVTVNLATDRNSGGDAAGDHLESIENLTGSALGDKLSGDQGANTLNGGAGNDTLAGGAGNDTYVLNIGTDSVIEGVGKGTDTIQSSVGYSLLDTDGAGSNGGNVENLTLLGAAVNGIGNALNNVITGNTANNNLNGGTAGNDTLNGGTGNDTLVGGTGNDTYVINVSTDVVTELTGAGTDTIQSSVGYSLVDTDGTGSNGGNIENLTLLAGALNGTGNALNNLITGNTGNNNLNGGTAGNDTLNGGTGNDTLVGGTGSDFFVFNSALSAATNRDVINDFSVAADTIRLENAVFAELEIAGTLSAANFHIGTVAADANDFIVYNSSTGALYFDADGNGVGATVQFATLATGLALTNADFVVI